MEDQEKSKNDKTHQGVLMYGPKAFFSFKKANSIEVLIRQDQQDQRGRQSKKKSTILRPRC